MFLTNVGKKANDAEEKTT